MIAAGLTNGTQRSKDPNVRTVRYGFKAQGVVFAFMKQFIITSIFHVLGMRRCYHGFYGFGVFDEGKLLS